MKITAVAFLTIFLTGSFSPAASMYLPVRSVTIQTQPMGETPAYQARLELDPDFRRISRAVLVVGGKEHELDTAALRGIEHPDLSSLRIEVERGMDGRSWVSMVLKPVRPTDHPTRFHITFIDGVFTQVTKTWDERQDTSITRRSEVLHKEPEPK